MEQTHTRLLTYLLAPNPHGAERGKGRKKEGREKGRGKGSGKEILAIPVLVCFQRRCRPRIPLTCSFVVHWGSLSALDSCCMEHRVFL